MSSNIKELLALCLCERADSCIVNALAAEYASVRQMMNVSEAELRLIKGIGDKKARQIKAIVEFAKEAYTGDLNRNPKIICAEDAFKFVRRELEFLQIEKFVVIGLTTKNTVVFKEDVSVGILNASLVHPRETFRSLIKQSCASCILVHNHPSGDSTPSREDIDLTKLLVEAGKVLQITVLDHLIVGAGGKYASLKAIGIIN
ncbi:MAG: DNA repair protein RadC [Sporomusaceae bacterium]|nr:DNA repair protein RadC [Sporomusaceae bacterium]